MKCLRCEEKAKPGCRGLCSQHYEQFRYARDKAAEKSREAATALDEAAVANPREFRLAVIADKETTSEIAA